MKNQGKQDTNSKSFITVWKVDSNDKIELSTQGNFMIDWGDGCVEQVRKHGFDGTFNYPIHTYVNSGVYTIKMYPEYHGAAGHSPIALTSGITSFNLVFGDCADQLLEVKQWGNSQWETMYEMFCKACNMTCSATDTPDLSKVKDMAHMFRGCKKFNSPIEHWDLRGVKSITDMLYRADAFNQDLRGLRISKDAREDDLFGNGQTLEQYTALDEKEEVLQVLN